MQWISNSQNQLVNCELIDYKHVEVMQIQGFKNPTVVELNCFGPVSGEIFGIIGQNPSVSKSTRLRVVIFRFLVTNWRYILQIPLKRQVDFPKSWTSTGYFSNSTDSAGTCRRFSPAGHKFGRPQLQRQVVKLRCIWRTRLAWRS